jgi:transcriptional regulator with XRE-family HTH domain
MYTEKFMQESIIKIRRKELKLTQEGLGDLCGVTKTAVLHWEKGVNEPKGRSLNLLSKFLHLESEVILNNDTSIESRSIFASSEPQIPVSQNKVDKISTNRSGVLLALAEVLNEAAIVSTIEEKSGVLTLNELELLEGLVLKSVLTEKANDRWPPQ